MLSRHAPKYLGVGFDSITEMSILMSRIVHAWWLFKENRHEDVLLSLQ